MKTLADDRIEDLPPLDVRPTPTPGSRIRGLDLARTGAMLGMLFVHYVHIENPASPVTTTVHQFERLVFGRAMSLFLVLGGVAVTLLSRRAAHPDKALLLRAAILFLLGLALEVLNTPIHIILQAYGLFFACALVLRRASSLVLSSLLVAIVATSGWTYQTTESGFEHLSAENLASPVEFVWTLLFHGGFPFFANGAFFVLGMLVGRLLLRGASASALLIGFGSALAVLPLLASQVLIAKFGVDVAIPRLTFAAEELEAVESVVTAGFRTEEFNPSALLYRRGHSNMPVWVVSAMGSSMLVIGAAVWTSRRFSGITENIETPGRMALTFYAVHLFPLTFWSPFSAGTGEQLLVLGFAWFGFWAFAMYWRRHFGSGPLERLLRFGSS